MKQNRAPIEIIVVADFVEFLRMKEINSSLTRYSITVRYLNPMGWLCVRTLQVILNFFYSRYSEYKSDVRGNMMRRHDLDKL